MPPLHTPQLALLLRRLGLGCVLVAVCSRVVTTTDPLPGWSLDPLTTVPPHNGMGPGLSIALASLAFFGLALVLAAAWRAGERVSGLLLVLAGLGLIPIAWHGWLGPTACIENAHTGLVWAAALAGALAASLACRHTAERALVIACCVGLAGPLAIRAAIQVYSEHPVLVADFEANREAFLASHGWSPDSAMGRSFERRLSQPDASAWFAMSNVYASVMAGCVAVFAAACLAAIRARLWTTGSRNDVYRLIGVFAGLVCALGGLFLALPAGGSLPKGAAAAMLLGLALLTLGVFLRRSSHRLARLSHPGLLGPLLIALALLAVVARGLIGEHLGELSLLFRFYYLEAAVRIFTEHPLLGVGPDGFQSAYLLAKNPLNPEEVSSPHSIFFDYASTLGLFGLAWAALLLTLAASAGTTLLRTQSTHEEPVSHALQDTPSPAVPTRTLLVVLFLTTLVSFFVETLPLARAVPDAFALVLVDGLTKLLGWSLLWLGLATALLTWTASPFLRLGLAAGVLALLTHAQIELTATDLSATGWVLVLLGAAAARPEHPLSCGKGSEHAPVSEAAPPRVPRLCEPCGAVLVGLLAIATLVSALPVRAWEAELRRTADLAAESTAFLQRAAALGPDSLSDSPLALGSDLAAALGRPVPATPEGINDALADLRLARVSEAADRLDTLARSPAAPSRAAVHAALQVRKAEATLRAQQAADPTRALARAIDLASFATTRWPTDSRLWRDLAQALFQATRLAPDAGLAEPFADLEPLRRAAALDPFSPQLAVQLARRYAGAGDTEQARLWAARALANHEFRRLDSLAGLSENHLKSMRVLLKTP